MSQPTFIQKIDGSNAATPSLTLTLTTTLGNTILVSVVLVATGAQTPAVVGGIIDSAGAVSGVPVNNWISLGSSGPNLGVRMEWWACKGTASITSLTIDLTYANSIIACATEYSGANGLTYTVFQGLLAAQNTIASLYIRETASTYPNSGAELMLGLFAMLSDTFNASASAPPGDSVTEVIRSTGSLSIPPALSYQIVEQGTVDASNLLNVNAVSATELATAANLALSSMQCLYIVISGGLILNTQPGFNDQPDTALAAGLFAQGQQMAKISGNAALGMVRMEFFQGIYTNGQTVANPVSPVDGYQYAIGELTFLWQVYNSANEATGWITGPYTLWYCGWNVNQLTGLVTSDEWYRNEDSSADSQDGQLQVFIVAQRQQKNLTAAAPPTWTQQNPSQFIQDYAYAQAVLTDLNDNAKFAVLGQECMFMGEFYNGQTVPTPVSPADDYAYGYSEVIFVYCWRWTCGQAAYVQPPWYGTDHQFGALYCDISSVGVVTCGVGWSYGGGDNYYFDSTTGRVSVFAFTQRARTGTPTAVGNQFAEIPNTLFYPGNELPGSLGAQLCKNINEAASSPEFFGPTYYLPGATIPVPTSPIDGYVYQRTELIYLWMWHCMDNDYDHDPRTYSSGSHVRTPLFSANINQSTGLVSTLIYHLAPGGPYSDATTHGILTVVVVGFRSSQQTAVSASAINPPSDAGTTIGDQTPPGAITVNGV